MRAIHTAIYCLILSAGASAAADDELRLVVPETLERSGLAQHLAPRFSLKTGIRISRVPAGETAQMAFSDGGTPVFVGPNGRWGLEHNGDARAERFLKWLQSEVGQRTIEAFTGSAGESYSAQLTEAAAEEEFVYEGDAAEGERLSLTHCGRCHVINDKNRMNGMGSTPSFAVLRSLPEWDRRFATFHLLNPHPSFTQVEGVTEPFDPSLPSPIFPMVVTITDVEAILAFVSAMAPADLGAPLQLQ